MGTKKTDGAARRPKLEPGISAAELTENYWLKTDLAEFAKRLGLPTHGYKPELVTRIERHLRGLPQLAETKSRSKGPRDSDLPLTRDTLVVNYKSDAKTREFFKSQIGPKFHFTYHLNQFRLANKGLTYGQLVDEWAAERDRRRSSGYQAPIAEHGKYNHFVRDFFADPNNEGKSLRDAATAWNAIKKGPGDPRFEPKRSE